MGNNVLQILIETKCLLKNETLNIIIKNLIRINNVDIITIVERLASIWNNGLKKKIAVSSFEQIQENLGAAGLFGKRLHHFHALKNEKESRELDKRKKMLG